MDIVSALLPRYYRVNSSSSSSSSSAEIFPVTWLPGFVAAPGYLKYDERIGVSMCASSEMAVRSLLQRHQEEKQPLGVRVLDLCCCPGMKFNSMADKLRPGDELMGIDVNERRMQTCISIVRKQLMNRHAFAHCILVIADGTTFTGPCSVDNEQGEVVFDSDILLDELEDMRKRGRKRINKSAKSREKKRLKQSANHITSICGTSTFDFVLVDAECSHDGSYRHLATMTEKPNALAIYEAEDRDAKMNALQCKLLSNGFKFLKPNGVLIYSTCRYLFFLPFFSTYNFSKWTLFLCFSLKPEQNEHVISWLLETQPDAARASMRFPCESLQTQLLRVHSLDPLHSLAVEFLSSDEEVSSRVVALCQADEDLLLSLSRCPPM